MAINGQAGKRIDSATRDRTCALLQKGELSVNQISQRMAISTSMVRNLERELRDAGVIEGPSVPTASIAIRPSIVQLRKEIRESLAHA